MLTIAATGHRPDKLGGYTASTDEQLFQLTKWWLEENRPAFVISGMALGWDTAVAAAALNLEIKLICAIPFPQQPARWPSAAVLQWAEIKKRAWKTVTLEQECSPHAMQLRNQWMVDQCDKLLALWNGSSGGTANCLRYARTQRKTVENLWKHFKEQPQCP